MDHADAFSLAPRRLPDGRLLLQLGGRFDGAAATELHHHLRGCESGERVVVDFSRLRQISDMALGMLAAGQQHMAPGCDVRVAGLAHHAMRILRAFASDLLPSP